MESPMQATAQPSAEQILESLTRVIDPTFGINIVDLGIIYGIEVDSDTATITMADTSPEALSRATIESDIRAILRHRHPDIETIDIVLTQDPPWRDDFISDAGRQQMLAPLPRQPLPDSDDGPLTVQEILDSLKYVIDPEVGVNIVDLGLIYRILIEKNAAHIEMTLTTPGCPLHATIAQAVRRILETRHPRLQDIQMELVWEPPWSTDLITPAGRTQLGW